MWRFFAIVFESKTTVSSMVLIDKTNALDAIKGMQTLPCHGLREVHEKSNVIADV